MLAPRDDHRLRLLQASRISNRGGDRDDRHGRRDDSRSRAGARVGDASGRGRWHIPGICGNRDGGLFAGTIMLQAFHWKQLDNVVAALVGGITALLAVASLCRARHQPPVIQRERSRWLMWAALPIGVEVGFSSAGAGALGSMALLCLTRLHLAAVLGTDLLFGLGLSIAGGGSTWRRRCFERFSSWRQTYSSIEIVLSPADSRPAFATL
jgi:hypothetical protein